MIYTLDDIDDEAEDDMDEFQRKAHQDYLEESPASGTWWRPLRADEVD